MKELQQRVKKFCEENKLDSPPEHRILDLVSEIGEVAKEILKMSDYGRKKPEYREEIRGELGDALYSLINVANYFDVDLKEAMELVLKKYEERLKRGSAGSGND